MLLIAVGLRRRRLSAGGLGGGTVMFLMVIVFTTLLTVLIWRAGSLWSSRRFDSWLTVSTPGAQEWLIIASFSALTVGVFAFRYHRALQREHLEDLIAGIFLAWIPLLLLTSFVGDGGSYLFLWPLVAGLPFLAWLLFVTSRPYLPLSRVTWFLAVLPASVAIFLWVPFLARLFLASGLSAFFVHAAAVALLLGMLLPLLAPLLRLDRSIVAGVSLLASVALFLAGFWLI
jgi:hypothetical protein